MKNEHSEKILEEVMALKSSVEPKVAQKLDLDKWERVLIRLDSFSPDCKECSTLLIAYNDHIHQLKEKGQSLESSDFIKHRHTMENFISHLQKEHKLVTEGTNQSIYMSLGLSLGVVFGLLFLDNLALGISFGFSIGIAIGIGLDVDAKKKGRTI
ncbi:hypothetical protein [Mesobacillus maritimus]|nr:hypothetical protein [Mesobacillus maritimus]